MKKITLKRLRSQAFNAHYGPKRGRAQAWAKERYGVPKKTKPGESLADEAQMILDSGMSFMHFDEPENARAFLRQCIEENLTSGQLSRSRGGGGRTNSGGQAALLEKIRGSHDRHYSCRLLLADALGVELNELIGTMDLVVNRRRA